MKKKINQNSLAWKILLLILLSNFTISYSQVGINTENIKGVFHIDGQSDNSKSGTIASDALKNDVIVDDQGSIGLKMNQTTPRAKVDLAADEAGKAFKLVDGNQSEGKALVGDKDGYASWGMLKGMGGRKMEITSPTGVIPVGTEAPLELSSGSTSLAINTAGNYIVMLRLTATYTGQEARISEIVRVYRNNDSTPLGLIENYVHVQDGKKVSNYVVIPVFGVQAKDKIKLTLYSELASLELDRVNSAVIFYRL